MFCRFPHVWGKAHAGGQLFPVIYICMQNFACLTSQLVCKHPGVPSSGSVDVRVGMITMGSNKAVPSWYPKKQIIVIIDDVQRSRESAEAAQEHGRNKPRYSTLPRIPVSRGILLISENPRGNIFALLWIIGYNSEKKSEKVGF